jgi:predicted RNA binding protein YcfA (HicA-like mRNA interferase family)
MAAKRITHGDIIRLLEVEGFSATVEKGDQVLFEKPSAGAALLLRSQRSSNTATGMALELVRRTMIDFGVMTEEDFDRWVADPKRYQAA